MRFRFQSLLQRWVLLTTYWNRTLREIEIGTYRRDLDRAHRHLAAKGGAPITEEEALRLGIPANRVKAFVGRQNKQAAAARRRRAAASAAAEPAPAAPPPAAGGAGRAGGVGRRRCPGCATARWRTSTSATSRPTPRPWARRPRRSLEQMRAKLEKDLPKHPGRAELRPRRAGRGGRRRQGPPAGPAGRSSRATALERQRFVATGAFAAVLVRPPELARREQDRHRRRQKPGVEECPCCSCGEP